MKLLNGARMTALRKWRRREELSLEEVSALTGFSPAMLSRAERDERRLSPQARVRIARRLGVPLRDLFPPEVHPDEKERPRWR